MRRTIHLRPRIPPNRGRLCRHHQVFGKVASSVGKTMSDGSSSPVNRLQFPLKASVPRGLPVRQVCGGSSAPLVLTAKNAARAADIASGASLAALSNTSSGVIKSRSLNSTSAIGCCIVPFCRWLASFMAATTTVEHFLQTVLPAGCRTPFQCASHLRAWVSSPVRFLRDLRGFRLD